MNPQTPQPKKHEHLRNSLMDLYVELKRRSAGPLTEDQPVAGDPPKEEEEESEPYEVVSGTALTEIGI